jgi:MFS family permease
MAPSYRRSKGGAWRGLSTGARPPHKTVHVGSWYRSARPVPAEYRSNFTHLYFDIAWFGVLAASTVSFTAIYATRQGANAFQLGLLSAAPAIVNMAFALPAGRWLEGQPIDTAVFWSALFYRIFYLLWLPLPLLFASDVQVWVLIGLTLAMSIPGTSLAVGFNALFAEAVPPEWRGHVAGIRNALLSITFLLVSLLCGLILEKLPFPGGYQVVFALGCLGAAMSTLHLWFITPRPNGLVRARPGRDLGDLASPGRFRLVVEGVRPGLGLRLLPRRPGQGLLKPGILRTPFARVVAVIFAFHLAAYLAIPLFPIRWVDQLHLSDQQIGWGTAVFYATVFVGSMQLDRLVRRVGNQRVTAIGALFMGFYPACMALAQGLGLYLFGSVLGGLGWALLGGALVNYVLERVPPDQRPAYLAWYNLAINTALLLGSLVGPLVAGYITVPAALMLFAVLRFLAALAILRWG